MRDAGLMRDAGCESAEGSYLSERSSTRPVGGQVKWLVWPRLLRYDQLYCSKHAGLDENHICAKKFELGFGKFWKMSALRV